MTRVGLERAAGRRSDAVRHAVGRPLGRCARPRERRQPRARRSSASRRAPSIPASARPSAAPKAPQQQLGVLLGSAGSASRQHAAADTSGTDQLCWRRHARLAVEREGGLGALGPRRPTARRGAGARRLRRGVAGAERVVGAAQPLPSAAVTSRRRARARAGLAAVELGRRRAPPAGPARAAPPRPRGRRARAPAAPGHERAATGRRRSQRHGDVSPSSRRLGPADRDVGARAAPRGPPRTTSASTRPVDALAVEALGQPVGGGQGPQRRRGPGRRASSATAALPPTSAPCSRRSSAARTKDSAPAGHDRRRMASSVRLPITAAAADRRP